MKNVVVIDDEIDVLEIIKHNLELLFDDSFKFIPFTNSLEARDHIYQHQADVVISDINMQQLNGIELYSSLRHYGYENSFIFLSGHVGEYQKDLLNIEQCFVFEKPAKFEKLANIISYAIDVQDFVENKKLEFLMKDFKDHDDFLVHFNNLKKIVAQKKMRHYTRLSLLD